MVVKRVVYTALFGDYDDLIPTPSSKNGIIYRCYTDQDIKNRKGWDIVRVNKEKFNLTESLLNRYYKLQPHLFLQDFDQSLYIDSNIGLLQDPTELFIKYLSHDNFLMPKHFIRECIYEEAKECILLQKDSVNKIEKQMIRYRAEGMPKKYGLGENNILFRNHNNKFIIKIMNDWWNEMLKETCRDQLSLGYIMWKNNIPFKYIEETARNGGGYFHYQQHKNITQKNFLSWGISKSVLKLRQARYMFWNVK
ncbi:DUF616 domain-containing protein [Escherichia coli]|uniref:glycosyltransferase domain-containing protein n=1 Tax=Escherichia coli TaxID=562 RepID=UPI000B7ECF83|nr:glycosyltransferase domain-containing protein [Escherichia coli]EKY4996841.1 DUF616 domain-containing protein [Escherichia coli]MBI1075771.1 DUF616 domain-containing protein [Escherichia coli]MCN2352225.1 DUF616 domain-containing protein [Escherichia coli]MCN2497593.1 DUF616 domain-containing protein [Escherichia coli]